MDRQAICHKFEIAGHEGYIHVGFYEDGTPGEIFIKMAKEGSTISGLMDTIATLTSLALQYGVPLEALVNKFSHVRFEPSGFTKNSDIPYAKSLTDYIFRFLGIRFLSVAQKQQIFAESQQIYTDLIAQIGQAPASPAVQANIARWHQHLRYFFEPLTEVLRALGAGYTDDPGFSETFRKMHPKLAAFMRAAIEIYCDRLS